MEPYADQNGDGRYSENEPFLDCNANSRWDGNFIGGGSDAPRFYTHVLDPVGARAFVVSSGGRKIAVEVLDHEGLFNTYMDRIRAKVAADGYDLDEIFISSTHDESAPDSLGLYGVNATTSSVNDYWTSYLVDTSAQAIEDAYDGRRAATIRYTVAQEPENMRQCWSSYPFVDNMRIPVLQAVDASGDAIVTLGNVSQHAETLGFNPDPQEKVGISSDWPHFFRQSLEQRYGGVAIEMAGAVGSVESPQVFSGPISGTPEQFFSAGHPAGCRTIFNPNGTTPPLGYDGETRVFGEQLGGRGRSRRSRLGGDVAVDRDLGRSPLDLRADEQRAVRGRRGRRHLREALRLHRQLHGGGAAGAERLDHRHRAEERGGRLPDRRRRVHLAAGRGVSRSRSGGARWPRTTCRSRSTSCRRGRCRTCTRRTGSRRASART